MRGYLKEPSMAESMEGYPWLPGQTWRPGCGQCWLLLWRRGASGGSLCLKGVCQMSSFIKGRMGTRGEEVIFSAGEGIEYQI